jgi:hypothetical protein
MGDPPACDAQTTVLPVGDWAQVWKPARPVEEGATAVTLRCATSTETKPELPPSSTRWPSADGRTCETCAFTDGATTATRATGSPLAGIATATNAKAVAATTRTQWWLAHRRSIMLPPRVSYW